MKLKELTTAGRILVISVIPVIWAAWVWLFATFETAETSEQKWAFHNQAIACKTVYELKAQIRTKEAQIQFDKSLTLEDKAFIQNQIVTVNDEIARIDPDGKC